MEKWRSLQGGGGLGKALRQNLRRWRFESDKSPAAHLSTSSEAN